MTETSSTVTTGVYVVVHIPPIEEGGAVASVVE